MDLTVPTYAMAAGEEVRITKNKTSNLPLSNYPTLGQTREQIPRYSLWQHHTQIKPNKWEQKSLGNKYLKA